ncbi:hypothetical protein [Nitrosomonas communis]|uniref:hypothetical protein n=1 Tax=Nitrosomonas communis TaxID=44574 RepID=UPI0026EF6804|nr:hypothetical protein [Nitrosomonas communis]MCO6427583.1 hypothetical protein [Nitrosomonas communis]
MNWIIKIDICAPLSLPSMFHVGCNKRSALHRKFDMGTYGAMPDGYCALRGRV